MRVIFKNNNITDDKRWQEAALLLEKYSEKLATQEKETGAVVEEFALELGRINNPSKESQRLISAASKFLWFAGYHEIRIFDKRAVDGLEILSNQKHLRKHYSSYLEVWEAQHEKYISVINKAVDALSYYLEWTCIPSCYHEEAKEALQNSWFADRVFDMFLWSIGTYKVIEVKG